MGIPCELSYSSAWDVESESVTNEDYNETNRGEIKEIIIGTTSR